MAANEGLARLLSSAIERAVGDVLHLRRVSGIKEIIYIRVVFTIYHEFQILLALKIKFSYSKIYRMCRLPMNLLIVIVIHHHRIPRR
jgi:hypothetical protein